jgi:hypothetical protein
MTQEERDISFPYMVKEEDVSDIDVRGGASLLNPVYCIGCELGGDKEMNLSQALDHVLHIHKVRKHRIYKPGVEKLQRNEERYREHMKRMNQERENA